VPIALRLIDAMSQDVQRKGLKKYSVDGKLHQNLRLSDRLDLVVALSLVSMRYSLNPECNALEESKYSESFGSL
jgi:hypothetical protein